MWGIVTIVLLSCASALLWLSYGFIASYQMFGLSAWPLLIHAAAALATAVLAVMLIAQITLRLVFPRLLRTDPNDLQRSLVFAVLSFAAVAVVLSHFGFDPTTILTTSAIVTAVVGLSIQPMLSSLLSGLSLDRAVRVGDGVLLDGEMIEVVSLNWRSVIGSRGDVGTVVLPNAQLTSGPLVVFSRDRPAQAEIRLEVAASVAPHRLRDLVRGVVLEFPEVDPAQPVVVRPIDYEPSRQFSRYRVIFWVRHYRQRGRVEDALLRRVWYVFQREKIVSHGSGAEPAEVAEPELLSTVASALRTAGANDAEVAQLAAQPERAIEAGELLGFGAGERIVFPSRLSGRRGLLVTGEVREMLRDQLEVHLSQQAWLKRIEQLLAEKIGPYAEYAVREASGGGASIMQICQTVARELDDPQAQASFIRAVNPPSDVSHQAGFLFQPQPEALLRPPAKPALYAIDHALILALPERPRDGVTSAKAKPAK